MSKQATQVAPKTDDRIKNTLEKMQPQFRSLLPNDAAVRRFITCVTIAVQNNPDLADKAHRTSLYKASLDCARENLIPDGKEAVLVTYNTNIGTREKPQWKTLVQYQPMVGGYVKRLRSSGLIAGAPNVQVWYENDEFVYQLGDEPRIHHIPALTNRGSVAGAYSIVKFSDGEVSRELMTIEEIESVRSRSKSANAGPWKTDFGEMARKTVFRRHCKKLPLEPELEALMEHDDDTSGLRDEFLINKNARGDQNQTAAEINVLTEQSAALPPPNAKNPLQKIADAGEQSEPVTIDGAASESSDAGEDII